MGERQHGSQPRHGGGGSQPQHDGRGSQGRDARRGPREDRVPRADRAPAIDPDVTGRELDKDVRRELATLASPVAGTVARHLVMAGRLLDSDPEAAHQHAQHARHLAGRVAVVREAAGYAAYEAGHFDVALRELRAARRISGRADGLAVMADCERGIGRPERALELAADPAAGSLDIGARAELAIVAAGALRDLGRPDEARATLEAALNRPRPQEQWVARAQYALGDVLVELGRTQDAVAAFAAAEAADVEGSLDSGNRLVALMEP
jgi:tetratricopeptide (TPR) repeat protein